MKSKWKDVIHGHRDKVFEMCVVCKKHPQLESVTVCHYCHCHYCPPQYTQKHNHLNNEPCSICGFKRHLTNNEDVAKTYGERICGMEHRMQHIGYELRRALNDNDIAKMYNYSTDSLELLNEILKVINYKISKT